MSKLYQEDYLFKAYFFNLYDKEIEVANTDEIVDAAQKLLINFTITENERQRLQLQNQIKDCKIRELELQIIQQNVSPFRSGSPDPKPKYPNPPKIQGMSQEN